MRFAAAPELDLRARTAVGAGDEQHGDGSMGDGCRRRLVDEAAGAEAVEREGGVDWMRLALGDRVREDVAGARRRLEAAGAPAAVDVEARDRREPDDGRAVGRDIDDAAPVAQHAQARELREQLADGLQRVRGDVQAALLAVGDVLVRAGADDELALVRLADVGVDRVGHHHAREHRLDGLRHQGLQREALERHAQARARHDHAGVAGRDDAHAQGADRPLRGLDAGDRAVRAAHEAQHLAVLDDVDAQRIGAARVAPGDRIVARDAAAALQGGADHGIAHVRRYVERRTERLGFLARSATRCRCRSVGWRRRGA